MDNGVVSFDRPVAEEPVDAGPAANARLTALAGAVLFVLLALLGLTIPGAKGHLSLHVFVGFLLVGPLLVKLASTGYRFLRYYTGDPRYGRAGPPRPLLRGLAPLVIATTLLVFGSGIALLAVSPGRSSTLVTLHKVTFLLWFLVMTVHVLAYLGKTVALASAELTARGRTAVLASRWARLTLVAAGVVLGLGLAIATRSLARPWVQWYAIHGEGR